MRLGYYAGASTAAAAACLLKAFHQRPNFYSATVYLSQSNACLLILTNLLLVLACSFMYGLQRLLYGPLRPIEIEQLSEKAWYAVLDTLLAMPSFREDVGGWLLAMFTLLLAGKVWGWIGEGRVDILEQQPPANPRLFHIRLATSLVLSIVFNLWMLDYCVETVMADPRPGMMVIFTFEFAILTVFSSFTFARYLLTCIQTRVEKVQMQRAIDDRKAEIRAERAAARQHDADATPAPQTAEEPIEIDENEVDVPGWEEKRRYLFALEVFTDFIKLLIYIVFFTVSITFNGLPMHIMRDVYMTFASFSKRVADYVAYRKATSDMNARYPDATTEEIRGDACIVCREIMVAWEQPAEAQQQQGQAQPAGQQPAPAPAPARRRDEGLRAKKLPCGHILHLRCLKSWLERQQVCPTCRRPVISATEANARGQPGAAGAGRGGQGAQGRQAGQRQGRARILNFGPVRIGFLNGPGDQINNIVRQMQNPGQQNAQAPAAGNAAAPQDAANPQGPNHLGLQVPYATNGQQGAPTAAPTATVPTQVQIQQIERRIMQEAQGLGIEQQQLATLRAMEAELGRLRAWHHYSRQGIQGAMQAPPNTGFLQPHFPQIPGAIMPWQLGQAHHHHHQHPLSSSQPPQVLHGPPTQQFGNGHESLPQGMTLPEGWTVMPLQPADGRQQVGVQRASAEGQSSVVPSAPLINVTSTYPVSAPGAETVEAQQQASDPGTGPTDERGSPLFVPTNPPATAEPEQAATNGETASSVSLPPSASHPQNPDEQPQIDHRPPWTSEGWDFVDPPNGQLQPRTNGEHATSSSADAATNDSSANGGPPESTGQGYEGKGKAKAAQVEDVPDEGT